MIDHQKLYKKITMDRRIDMLLMALLVGSLVATFGYVGLSIRQSRAEATAIAKEISVAIKSKNATRLKRLTGRMYGSNSDSPPNSKYRFFVDYEPAEAHCTHHFVDFTTVIHKTEFLRGNRRGYYSEIRIKGNEIVNVSCGYHGAW